MFSTQSTEENMQSKIDLSHDFIVFLLSFNKANIVDVTHPLKNQLSSH